MRTAIWGYFNIPSKTIRKRTIPFISHMKAAGLLNGGYQINTGAKGRPTLQQVKDELKSLGVEFDETEPLRT